MAVFSLIVALVTALFVSLFSGFPGLLPVLLYFVLLLINCQCLAANVCEEDKNSMMFMAIISSALVVLLCSVIVSNNLNAYLCDIGYQDPDKVHPLVPFLVIVFTIVIYRVFVHRASQDRLLVQKVSDRLMTPISARIDNPRLERIRRTMIKEGILTERLKDEE